MKQFNRQLLSIIKNIVFTLNLSIILIGCIKTNSVLKSGENTLIAGSSFQAPDIVYPVKCGYDINELSLTLNGWRPIFDEQFNTGINVLNPFLDLTKWTYWNTGAYNNELQLYQFNNLNLVNGDLQIEAKKEDKSGVINPEGLNDLYKPRKDFHYTSGRIESKQSFKGSDHSILRIYARIKLPSSPGLWPAFWTYGYGGTWPGNGEIDIMEARGQEPYNYQTNYFYGSSKIGLDEQHLKSKDDLTACYHLFMLEWSPTTLKFYLDDELKDTKIYTGRNGANIPNLWDKEQHIVLNLAYGGDFFIKPFVPGNILNGTGTMFIDFVKVYEKIVYLNQTQ